jgi:hypothetical protein
MEAAEAADADSTENQVDKTSQQMEKKVPELTEVGIMAISKTQQTTEKKQQQTTQ